MTSDDDGKTWSKGRNAIRLAIMHLKGEKLEKSYLIECPPVIKENTHQYEGQF